MNESTQILDPGHRHVGDPGLDLQRPDQQPDRSEADLGVPRPYSCFLSTITQIYTLCGGTRLITGDLADLEAMCAELRGQENLASDPLAWPDRLAQAQAALLRATSEMFAVLARHGYTASVLPGGELERLEAQIDTWAVLRIAAEPDLIPEAIEAFERAGSGYMLAAEVIDRRRATWVDRVFGGINRDKANRSRAIQRTELAASLASFATRCSVQDLGLTGTSPGATALSTSLSLSNRPGYAGQAEWCALAEAVVADLQSERPRLRVIVPCPSCHRSTIWTYATRKLDTACCQTGIIEREADRGEDKAADRLAAARTEGPPWPREAEVIARRKELEALNASPAPEVSP